MSDALITSPAYIELDIPSPMAECVRELRQRFDFERSNLPAEISLSGSGGLGMISCGQSVSTVCCLIEEAARKIKPFPAVFKSVERFPNTDIYFLSFLDNEPFFKAQQVIAESGIQFEKTPYPFYPHCTLRLRKPPKNAQEILELFFLQTPQEPFVLSTLSLYTLEENNECELLCKVDLDNNNRKGV